MMQKSFTRKKDGREWIERLKLQHSTWLEEYKQARTESLTAVVSVRQSTQIALVAFVAEISLSSSVVQNDFPIVFLLIPFIFYAIVCFQIRMLVNFRVTCDFIHDNLRVGINDVLQKIDDRYELPSNQKEVRDQQGDPIKIHEPIWWEEHLKEHNHPDKLHLIVIETSLVLIPLAMAVVSPVAYIAYVYHYHLQIPASALICMWFNELTFTFILYSLLWVRAFSRGNVQIKKEKGSDVTWKHIILACLMAIGLAVTTGSVREKHNLSEQAYTKSKRVDIGMTDGTTISGALLEHAGPNYVIAQADSRLLIDKSLVSSVADCQSYAPSPTIMRVEPDGGAKAGGNVIEIEGKDFSTCGARFTITIGGKALVNQKSLGDKTIVGIVPSGVGCNP